ncbi:hypothetical protein [Tumebacillus flagellatus]|uniref:hypothetical protein n=1 Tax=Tumebacillus flagellatus TaxID=1157490 RepID=UPI001267852A|nr:hypothetical protein [Tumebacillus flagellatus]
MIKMFRGYHGTDATRANVIDDDGLIPSSKWHWLGGGYYYYDDDSLAARWGGPNPVVYTSILEAEANRVLDTMSANGRELLDRIWSWLNSESSHKLPNLRSNQDHLAYTLVEVLQNEDLGLIGKFDMIRAIYNKSAPLQNYFQTGLTTDTEIHICVKNIECIKSFERVCDHG